MLLRIIKETFLHRRKWVALALVAVLLGAALAAAMLTVYGDVTDKMSQELRSFGANILVRPAKSLLELEVGGINYTPPGARVFLDEGELPRMKTIFWRHNIVGWAPFLSIVAQAGEQPVVLTGTWFEKTVSVPDLAPRQFAGNVGSAPPPPNFTTGVKKISPWWRVNGDWVVDDDMEGAIVGVAMAERLGLAPGDRFDLSYGGKTVSLRTAGIVSTGGLEDNQVFVSLPVTQSLLGITRGADKVLVSALVTSEDKVAPEIRGKSPEEMTPEEYELWYCTPLVASVAYQIEEVITGAEAGPIRQIVAAEGSFLTKTETLLLLITVAALAASALSVMAAMNTMVVVRRREIGLMKAIGADDAQVAVMFFLEAGIIGLVGGLLGFLGGLGLAQFIGREVFGMTFAFSPVALPLTVLLAVAVALAGSLLPVRQAMKIKPVLLLHEV